jgi:plasmid stabilization system protein ParE
LAKVKYAPDALLDFDRLAAFLPESGADPDASLDALVDGIAVLARHPLIGRKLTRGLRELIVSFGSTGYIVLYDFAEAEDAVRVFAIRHQREQEWSD